jgi:hypothetical protein
MYPVDIGISVVTFQNLFYPPMPDEAIGGADHPIPSDNIARCLCGCIPGDRPPDPRVLAKDIVDPPLYNEPVLEKILADESIPEKGPVIPGEGRGFLLPAIITGRIQFEPRHREPAQFKAMV